MDFEIGVEDRLGTPRGSRSTLLLSIQCLPKGHHEYYPGLGMEKIRSLMKLTWMRGRFGFTLNKSADPRRVGETEPQQ